MKQTNLPIIYFLPQQTETVEEPVEEEAAEKEEKEESDDEAAVEEEEEDKKPKTKKVSLFHLPTYLRYCSGSLERKHKAQVSTD